MFQKYQFIFILIVFVACSDTTPFLRKPHAGDYVQLGKIAARPNHENVVTFYALGDWGTGDDRQRAVAKALKRNVKEIPVGRRVAPFVVGLGDNIYEDGLASGWNNPTTRRRLEETFGKMYTDIKYNGENIVFHIVPGNHDHNNRTGGKNGLGDVIHQETTAEKIYSHYWKYYPIDATKNTDSEDSTNYETLKSHDIFRITIPERVPIEAMGTLAFSAIDTQVLLDLYVKEDSELLQLHWNTLEELLQENADWKIILGHHPIESYGKHNGFRRAFWWLPPIFLAAIIDKLLYKPQQDLDNPAYKNFRKDLRNIMMKHDVTVYLAGHEHNLQFLELDKTHFQLVSGSAAKLSGVTHKSDTIFSHASHGFVRFDVTQDEMWLEFFQVDTKYDTSESTAQFKISKN